MDSRKLMIGDWVRMKECPNFKFKMEDVSGSPLFNRYADNGQTCVPYSYGEIEPIPLNEEIIEAQGFMKISQPNCYFPFHWAFYQTNAEDEEAFDYTIKAFNSLSRGMRIEIRNCINDACLSCQCEFVHELQHALRVCEIDKETTL